METIQDILTFLTFLGAVSFIFGKFIWKPAFLKSKKQTTKSCGKTGDGCC